jgi:hypothetical protein
MFALEVIHALNNRPAPTGAEKRRASLLVNSAGAVLHSARYRSTIHLSEKSTRTVFPRNGNPYERKDKRSRDLHFSAVYWQGQSEKAIHAFVEACFDGHTADKADEAATRSARPDWSFRVTYAGGGRIITATRPDGGLVRSESALSWRWIHHRTAD